MNLRPFEIVLIGIFGFLALAGLGFLALNKAGSGAEEIKRFGESVSIWGTQDRSVIEGLLKQLEKTDVNYRVVKYTQVDARTFNSELLGAIAAGRSPDLAIIPHSSLLTYRSIIVPVKYESFPLGDFRSQYVDGAEIFLDPNGVWATPLFVDPLLMYWNRDVLAAAAIAVPPLTWETLLAESIAKLTKRTDATTLTQSAVALGSYTNISYAKQILSTLLLQAGAPIVTNTTSGYSVSLNEKSGIGLPAGEAAIPFYTQFVNPNSEYYTWNQTLPSDRAQFLGGKLGLWFAPASVRDDISRQNPNLSYDVTTFPQGESATARRTYGEFYGLVILKASRNQAGAYAAARALGQAENASQMATKLALAPVHRAVLNKSPTDAWGRSTYASALIARGWLDPNPTQSDKIFSDMINSIISGRLRVSDALSTANRQLELLIK